MRLDISTFQKLLACRQPSKPNPHKFTLGLEPSDHQADDGYGNASYDHDSTELEFQMGQHNQVWKLPSKRGLRSPCEFAFES